MTTTRKKTPVTTITFEVDGESFTADLAIGQAPTPRYTRLTKHLDALMRKDASEMTEDEGADAILLTSEYLGFHDIDADDFPAPKLFAVLRGFFEAIKDQQEVTPGNSRGSAKRSRSTTTRSRTNS